MPNEITPNMRSNLRDAVFHLCSCWNALNALEFEADLPDIETYNIQGLAGNIGLDPSEVYDLNNLPDAMLDEHLAKILEEVQA